MSPQSRTLEITNRRGLHARASAKFVNLAANLAAKVEVADFYSASAANGCAYGLATEGVDTTAAFGVAIAFVAPGFFMLQPNEAVVLTLDTPVVGTKYATGEQAGPPEPRTPSGRVRHDEKMTVYVTADELLDIEHARLSLRRHQGLAVDRGRLVREAIAMALADLEVNGDDSVLVDRLIGR